MTTLEAKAAAKQPESWEATRALTGMATRLVGDQDDYLAQTQRSVGRQVGTSQWEIFVACEPAEALEQQFESIEPDFIALHDIGTQGSRRMLAGLAAAMQRPVHQLHIRRQGVGMPLAKIEFVELRIAGDGPPLRLYSTDVDADSVQRRRVAHTLLAFSRLGVAMVGELPPHALAAALMPLRDAIAQGPWTNRHLLMLPLAGASALATQAAQVASGKEVLVRATPLVTRPAEAWGYLKATWNRLREQLLDDAITVPELLDPHPPGTGPAASASSAAKAPAGAAAAPVVTPAAPAHKAPAAKVPAAAPARAPLPMQPMPTPRATTEAPKADAAIATYLARCGELKGVIACCVFELATQRSLGHVGSRPGPAALASHGASLMASLTEAAQALHLGDAAPDAAITYGAHHELLRALPGRPGLALHMLLDKSVANLTLVRLQIDRLDPLLNK